MLLVCQSCNEPLSAGCRGVPGADGYAIPLELPDGSVRIVAYHRRAPCNRQAQARTRSLPLRLLPGALATAPNERPVAAA